MAITLSLGLQKGGIGKTTCSLFLGWSLQNGVTGKKEKVLGIDLDPQGNLTESVGYDPVECQGFTIYEALTGERTIDECLIPGANKELFDLVPANDKLSDFELWAYNNSQILGDSLPTILNLILEPLKKKYDRIVIDLPPSKGMLTLLGLCASNYIIIPTQAERFSTTAIPRFIDFITTVQNNWNANLKILGILVNQVNIYSLHGDHIQAMRRQYGDLVFENVVKKRVRIAQITATSLLKTEVKEKDIEDTFVPVVREMVEREQIQ